MSTASYNCPCCGGPLKFSGESGKLECASCGNSYEPEALEMMTPEESGEEISFASSAERFDAGESGVQGYVCKNCGGHHHRRRMPLLRQPDDPARPHRGGREAGKGGSV